MFIYLFRLHERARRSFQGCERTTGDCSRLCQCDAEPVGRGRCAQPCVFLLKMFVATSTRSRCPRRCGSLATPNNQSIKSPNIQRLAAEGVAFQLFYVAADPPHQQLVSCLYISTECGAVRSDLEAMIWGPSNQSYTQVSASPSAGTHIVPSQLFRHRTDRVGYSRQWCFVRQPRKGRCVRSCNRNS